MSKRRWWCVCLVVSAVCSIGCPGCASTISGDVMPTASLGVDNGGESASTLSCLSDTETVALETIPAAFGDLAALMGGTPIFSPDRLPEDASVAERWWPVVEAESEADEQRWTANPHVTDEGGLEPEGQLLMSSGTGWLVVLENFRGDLGEVSGEPIGTVAGESAHLYEVNGGWLVQWAFEGRWYGVFGRDVDAETVIALAGEMSLVEAD